MVIEQIKREYCLKKHFNPNVFPETLTSDIWIILMQTSTKHYKLS